MNTEDPNTKKTNKNVWDNKRKCNDFECMLNISSRNVCKLKQVLTLFKDYTTFPKVSMVYIKQRPCQELT